MHAAGYKIDTVEVTCQTVVLVTQAHVEEDEGRQRG